MAELIAWLGFAVAASVLLCAVVVGGSLLAVTMDVTQQVRDSRTDKATPELDITNEQAQALALYIQKEAAYVLVREGMPHDMEDELLEELDVLWYKMGPECHKMASRFAQPKDPT